jgi:hypothetical protein
LKGHLDKTKIVRLRTGIRIQNFKIKNGKKYSLEKYDFL